MVNAHGDNYKPGKCRLTSAIALLIKVSINCKNHTSLQNSTEKHDADVLVATEFSVLVRHSCFVILIVGLLSAAESISDPIVLPAVESYYVALAPSSIKVRPS